MVGSFRRQSDLSIAPGPNRRNASRNRTGATSFLDLPNDVVGACAAYLAALQRTRISGEHERGTLESGRLVLVSTAGTAFLHHAPFPKYVQWRDISEELRAKGCKLFGEAEIMALGDD